MIAVFNFSVAFDVMAVEKNHKLDRDVNKKVNSRKQQVCDK